MEMETLDNVRPQPPQPPVKKSHEGEPLRTLKPSSPPTLPTSIRPGAPSPTSEQQHLSDSHSAQSPGALPSSVQREVQKVSEITQESELPLPKAVSSSTTGHSSVVGDTKPLVQKFVKEVETFPEFYADTIDSSRIEELLEKLPKDTYPEAFKEAVKAVIMSALLPEHGVQCLIDMFVEQGAQRAQLTLTDKDVEPNVLNMISSKIDEKFN